MNILIVEHMQMFTRSLKKIFGEDHNYTFATSENETLDELASGKHRAVVLAGTVYRPYDRRKGHQLDELVRVIGEMGLAKQAIVFTGDPDLQARAKDLGIQTFSKTDYTADILLEALARIERGE